MVLINTNHFERFGLLDYKEAEREKILNISTSPAHRSKSMIEKEEANYMITDKDKIHLSYIKILVWMVGRVKF